MKTGYRVLEAGIPIDQANKALIILHGRGASAEDILSLGSLLPLSGFHILAPEAKGNTWYPYSFLAPAEQNEPWLSQAIDLVSGITEKIINSGLQSDQIYFLGFSQGACLTLEFTSRFAQRWGGIIAFSGGLIGKFLRNDLYKGNFSETRVFIGNSDVDPHIPLIRCQQSADIMKKMGASVKLQIYPGMAHTVNDQEIEEAGLILHSVD